MGHRVQLYRPQLRSVHGARRALSNFISATKIATAEWVRTRLSMIPTAEDNPASLMIGWGSLLENREEHEDE
jgi:hypothetical protein